MSQIHFRQFRDPETDTFSYLIGCAEADQAAIIDPVAGRIPLYLGVLNELDLRLTWVLETHLHADHLSAADTLRARTGAQIAVGRRAGIENADKQLDEGDTVTVGALTIDVMATPGHTPGCLTYRCAERLFTGDCLLIGGCGRIDEPGGNGTALYDTVTRRLLCLADEMLVYPGHCLDGRRVSCIGEERERNPYFHGVSRDGFMALKTSEPEQLPPMAPLAWEANRRCGRAAQLQAEKAFSTGVGQQF